MDEHSAWNEAFAKAIQHDPNQEPPKKAEISPKALRGKGGFLFLGGPDSNNIQEYFSGKTQISRSSITIHRKNLDNLSSLPYPHSVLIVPEAHVVYPELLPDDFKLSLARPVTVLTAEHPGRIIYPLAEFEALKKHNVPVYTGRDPHWTGHAAIEAYKICRAAQGITKPFVPQFTPNVFIEVGDLTIFDPDQVRERLRELRTSQPEFNARLVYSNAIDNNGSIIIQYNPDAPMRRCLAFGTSFSTNLGPIYTSDFREVIFVYGTAVDTEFVQLLEPDHVFVEMPERFVHMPHLAIPGSVFCSHALAAHRDHADGPGELAPEELQDLVQLLTSIPGSGSLVASRGLPVSELTLERLRFIETLDVPQLDRDLIRVLLSGHYLRDWMKPHFFRIMDSGLFNEHIHLIPPSEAGLMLRCRAYAGVGRTDEAIAELVSLFGSYDPSPESFYLEEYLRNQRNDPFRHRGTQSRTSERL